MIISLHYCSVIEPSQESSWKGFLEWEGDSADPSRSVPVLWMSIGEVGCVVTPGFLTPVLVLGIGCQVEISFGLTTLQKFCEC